MLTFFKYILYHCRIISARILGDCTALLKRRRSRKWMTEVFYHESSLIHRVDRIIIHLLRETKTKYLFFLSQGLKIFPLQFYLSGSHNFTWDFLLNFHSSLWPDILKQTHNTHSSTHSALREQKDDFFWVLWVKLCSSAHQRGNLRLCNDKLLFS